jgi:hypothetical protein
LLFFVVVVTLLLRGKLGHLVRWRRLPWWFYDIYTDTLFINDHYKDRLSLEWMIFDILIKSYSKSNNNTRFDVSGKAVSWPISFGLHISTKRRLWTVWLSMTVTFQDKNGSFWPNIDGIMRYCCFGGWRKKAEIIYKYMMVFINFFLIFEDVFN